MGVVYREGEYSWIRYIKQRIRQNKNVLIAVSGPTGSGKTWSAGAICELVDPNFGIDNCVFKAMELMQLINSGKLKKGSAILFDEAGVEMNNKSWNTVTNRMLNYLVQTFRHRNFVLLFTSPYIDFVDSSTRKLFHAEFQTMSIDHKENTCSLKPKLIQYNSRYQKFYYKFLRTRLKDKGYVPVKTWKVPRPQKEWIGLYETKKRKFTDALNERILKDLQAAEEKARPKDWYPHECPSCGHHWQSLKKVVDRCPKRGCQKTMPKKTENMPGIPVLTRNHPPLLSGRTIST